MNTSLTILNKTKHQILHNDQVNINSSLTEILSIIEKIHTREEWDKDDQVTAYFVEGQSHNSYDFQNGQFTVNRGTIFPEEIDPMMEKLRQLNAFAFETKLRADRAASENPYRELWLGVSHVYDTLISASRKIEKEAMFHKNREEMEKISDELGKAACGLLTEYNSLKERLNQHTGSREEGDV